MSQLDVFHRTLTSLHEATLNDEHWPATSALIDEACRVKGNQLVVGGGFGSDVKVFFARNYHRGQRQEEFERDYFLNYHPHDERLPRLRQLPDGKLVHVTELYTEQELKTSPTYNEALARSSSQNSLNIRMDGPRGARIVWALADPVHMGGWWSMQIEMVERLLPHIRQFVRVRQVLASAEGLRVSLIGLLDNARIGVIHLDRRGRITEANDLARDILRQGDGLWDQNGFPVRPSTGRQRRLEGLLGGALPTLFGEAVSGSMTIRRPPGLPRLALHVSPLGVHQMDFGALRVAALVLVVDPQSGPRIAPELVAATLGLTPAESRVAAMLAEGRTVRDMAVATDRKESTVRWLLNRVYDKQGISRQADLVRLVLSLAELSRPRR